MASQTQSTAKLYSIQYDTITDHLIEKFTNGMVQEFYLNSTENVIENRSKFCKKYAEIWTKIGYPIFADLPTYLYPIISDFCKPTYLPNRRISYVDGP